MSAAAILSVAARKAASEGKKVGAAALTLIALVVMSLTVFPGLNRATTDQMAEAPSNTGSSESSNQGSVETELEIAPTPDNGIVDNGAEGAVVEGANPSDSATPLASPSPKASAKAEQEVIKSVLASPSAGAVYNSNSKSIVLVFDQNYTAIGDNGLKAYFTFNPTSPVVFSNVKVEVEIDGFVFDFKPANTELISGKNAANLDVYMLIGDATFLFDENGKNWSKSELGKSRVVIEVIMELNGQAVKSVNLALYSR
jgi:hypothetical protein